MSRSLLPVSVIVVAAAVTLLLSESACGTPSSSSVASSTSLMHRREGRLGGHHESLYSLSHQAGAIPHGADPKYHHQHMVHEASSPLEPGYHVHSWISKDAEPHPDLFDVDLLPGLDTARSTCVATSEKLTEGGVAAKKLHLRFKGKSAAEAALEKLNAKLHHVNPSKVRGGHTPFVTKLCGASAASSATAAVSPTPVHYMAYQAAVQCEDGSDACSVVASIRRCLMHEHHKPGAAGGIQFEPSAPAAVVSLYHDRQRRAMKTQQNSLAVEFAFSLSEDYPLTVIAGQSYFTAWKITGCTSNPSKMELIQEYSSASSFCSYGEASTTTLTDMSMRSSAFTVKSSATSSTCGLRLSIKVTCDGEEKTAKRDEIRIVNSNSPGSQVAFLSPKPYTSALAGSSTSTIKIELIAAADSDRAGHKIKLMQGTVGGWYPDRGSVVGVAAKDTGISYTLKSSDTGANPSIEMDISDLTVDLTAPPLYWLEYNDEGIVTTTTYKSSFFWLNHKLTTSSLSTEFKVMFEKACTECEAPIKLTDIFCQTCSRLVNTDTTDIGLKVESRLASGSIDITWGTYWFDRKMYYALGMDAAVTAKIENKIAFEATYENNISIPLSPLPALEKTIELPTTVATAVGADTLELKVGLSQLILGIQGTLQIDGTVDVTLTNVAISIKKTNWVDGMKDETTGSIESYKIDHSLQGLVEARLFVGPRVEASVSFGELASVAAVVEAFVGADIKLQYPALAADSSLTDTNCQKKHFLEVSPFTTVRATFEIGGTSEIIKLFATSFEFQKWVQLTDTKCFIDATGTTGVISKDLELAFTNAEVAIAQLRHSMKKKLSVPMGAVQFIKKSTTGSRRQAAVAYEMVYLVGSKSDGTMFGSKTLTALETAYDEIKTTVSDTTANPAPPGAPTTVTSGSTGGSTSSGTSPGSGSSVDIFLPAPNSVSGLGPVCKVGYTNQTTQTVMYYDSTRVRIGDPTTEQSLGNVHCNRAPYEYWLETEDDHILVPLTCPPKSGPHTDEYGLTSDLCTCYAGLQCRKDYGLCMNDAEYLLFQEHVKNAQPVCGAASLATSALVALLTVLCIIAIL